MKLGVLFSGGKDSAYAALLASKEGYEVSCLMTIESENEASFMFHTPAIELTRRQAELMNIPLLFEKTKGEKEVELEDLEKLIKRAVLEYKIEGVVTGAVESVYQASRVQRICNKLGLECFNPLWQKDQWELLDDLIKDGLNVVVSGVFAYPFDESWVGRKIDGKFLKELHKIQEELDINPAGEGGEFESLVVNGPMFSEEMKIKDIKVHGEGHSWRGEFLI
jgi:ABC transporter with metal-binding/Fe-S-binding domain ATP-binding protein